VGNNKESPHRHDPHLDAVVTADVDDVGASPYRLSLPSGPLPSQDPGRQRDGVAHKHVGPACSADDIAADTAEPVEWSDDYPPSSERRRKFASCLQQQQQQPQQQQSSPVDFGESSVTTKRPRLSRSRFKPLDHRDYQSVIGKSPKNLSRHRNTASATVDRGAGYAETVTTSAAIRAASTLALDVHPRTPAFTSSISSGSGDRTGSGAKRLGSFPTSLPRDMQTVTAPLPAFPPASVERRAAAWRYSEKYNPVTHEGFPPGPMLDSMAPDGADQIGLESMGAKKRLKMTPTPTPSSVATAAPASSSAEQAPYGSSSRADETPTRFDAHSSIGMQISSELVARRTAKSSGQGEPRRRSLGQTGRQARQRTLAIHKLRARGSSSKPAFAPASGELRRGGDFTGSRGAATYLPFSGETYSLGGTRLITSSVGKTGQWARQSLPLAAAEGRRQPVASQAQQGQEQAQQHEGEDPFHFTESPVGKKGGMSRTKSARASLTPDIMNAKPYSRSPTKASR